MTSEQHGAGEPSALHKVQVVNAVQRRIIDSVLNSMVPESTLHYWPDETGGIGTRTAALDLESLLLKLL